MHTRLTMLQEPKLGAPDSHCKLLFVVAVSEMLPLAAAAAATAVMVLLSPAPAVLTAPKAVLTGCTLPADCCPGHTRGQT